MQVNCTFMKLGTEQLSLNHSSTAATTVRCSKRVANISAPFTIVGLSLRRAITLESIASKVAIAKWVAH